MSSRSLTTDVHRVAQAGETLFISLEAVSAEDFDEHGCRDLSLPLEITVERMEIPIVSSEIHLWDGGDRLYPHLHFTCPRCRQVHNADLEDDDPNPRWGSCDSCSWESLVWIEWDEARREAMIPEMDKEVYLAREIAAMRLEPRSPREVEWLMYSLERFATFHPDAACELMIELWPIVSAASMHHVCDEIEHWLHDRRSPGIMARLAQLVASEEDPGRRERCLKLLEDLQSA